MPPGSQFARRSGRYPAEIPSVNLDAEWLYRRLFPALYRIVVRALQAVRDFLGSWLRLWSNGLMTALDRTHGLEGTLARTWPTGSMVLWVAVLLAVFLVLDFI